MNAEERAMGRARERYGPVPPWVRDAELRKTFGYQHALLAERCRDLWAVIKDSFRRTR